MRRYYQETAEDYRRADGKSRSFRGNCLCDGRWTCSCIVRNTNTLLSRQVDEADSYSRRSCMIVTGSPKAQEWWNKRGWRVKRNVAKEAKRGENDFRKHVNKIHPIANAKNRNQARIIKFTIHRFKEKVFLRHKRNKKTDNGKKKKKSKTQVPGVRLNVQPSLSRNRIDLLRKAKEVIEGNENFKFAYADMHGNLKFELYKPLDRKYSL